MTDFITAYENHVWDVYGYFAYRMGSRADAEDLTQLAFERAYRAWGRYDERKASVRTWLLAIARNALIDHSRRRQTHESRRLTEDEVAEAELPSVPGPEETSLGISPELEGALAGLSDRDREVLALRFGADLPGPEISDILELSLANVQQILSRTLRKLRAELEGTAVAPDVTPRRDHLNTEGAAD